MDKLVKQPRLLLDIGKYFDPPLAKMFEVPKVGPVGLIQFGRFDHPSPKVPVKIQFKRKTWR